MNPVSQQEQRLRNKRGRQRKYDDEFRRNALEQMKTSSNIAELARKLGIRRKWLYHWRDEATGRVSQPADTAQRKIVENRDKKLIAELQGLVARQAQDIEFFRGALLRVEEKRRKREQTSGTPSTSKSGK